MEELKRLLRAVRVPFLFLVIGFGMGLLVHRTFTPTGRFVATGAGDTIVVLDSKTGQYCVPGPYGNGSLPHCLDLYRKY